MFLIFSLFLFWTWESDKYHAAVSAEQAAQAEIFNNSIAASEGAGKLIKIKSDALELTVDLKGGDIVDAKLCNKGTDRDDDQLRCRLYLFGLHDL